MNRRGPCEGGPPVVPAKVRGFTVPGATVAGVSTCGGVAARAAEPVAAGASLGLRGEDPVEILEQGDRALTKQIQRHGNL